MNGLSKTTETTYNHTHTHNGYSHKNPLPDKECSCWSPDEKLFLSGEFLSIRNK
jgi:hypothetical protein